MKPENKKENINACLCPACPLYGGCNSQKTEKFFCGAQKSDCLMDRNKPCICGGCPVFNKYNLSEGYFCINEIAEID